jgi:hypothetical protein
VHVAMIDNKLTSFVKNMEVTHELFTRFVKRKSPYKQLNECEFGFPTRSTLHRIVNSGSRGGLIIFPLHIAVLSVELQH